MQTLNITPAEQTLDEQACWQAVLVRSREADGTFVTAVLTTKIYCRPWCPARHPKRENVTFFRHAEQAEAAGFRPCKRCLPQFQEKPEPQTGLVEEICCYIESHLDEALSLDDLGQHFHLTPSYLQRSFKRLRGISPRQYAESCRMQQFKARLQQGETVTDALYNAGYQSSSRVYEQAPARLGMTPGTYRLGGKGTRITYTFVESSPGYVLLAATERGVAAVRFGETLAALEINLAAEYPEAERVRDDESLRSWAHMLSRLLHGQPTTMPPLDVQGTGFQWLVWEALRRIPVGQTRSYQEVAAAIGQPSAARAVARACASNPVAIFIPCHRVVRANGETGGYRWGTARKQWLLDQEKSHSSH